MHIEIRTTSAMWVPGIEINKFGSIYLYLLNHLVRSLTFLICMNILLAFMYMLYVHACCPQGTEEGFGFCRTGVSDGCEPNM